MEHWNHSPHVTTENPDSFSQQQIINDILRMSLEPLLFQELLERILSYLVNQRELLLRPKAAVFLTDQETEQLVLRASLGFTEPQKTRCANVQFGHCDCGQAARTGAIHFFTDCPPLATTDDPEDGNGHYCIPILKDSQAIGVLTLCVDKTHQPSTRTRELFESIGNILATVIESQKMDQQLIELVNDLRISIINLREEKQFTESIIQSLHHGLLVTDLQGTIIKSNNVARRILEPFVDELDGKSLQGLVGTDHAEMLTTGGQDVTSYTGKDVSLSTGEGQEFILSISGAPRKDARGNHVGYIVSLLDVTELRYARKEMEKMNRLSTVAEIASAVAHEVRNPLAGIKIMAQSIEEDAVDNEQQLECSRRIIRQVDRLNELLTEFFSYARPVEPKKRPISIRSILAETRPLISNRLMQNAIDLIEDIAPDLPDVIADPNQMQQVFLNLMLNATDAIRQNGTITINARFLVGHKLSIYKKRYPGLLTDNRYVLVVFSDNGAGMPANVVDKVFEPFFTTKTTGTGLGLSIVYRTLRENGAAISLESQQGKGTTFNMFFQTGE